MGTKEVLKRAINDIKAERNWIRVEGKFIEKLKKAVEKGDYKKIRRFERKAARYEGKIYQFEERVLNIIDFLRQRFPAWSQALSEFEQNTKMYSGFCLSRCYTYYY